jgi:hypothetical protein
MPRIDRREPNKLLVCVPQLQALFDTLDALDQSVMAGVRLYDVAKQIRAVPPQAGDGRFQASQAALDLADVILNSTNIGANGAQVFQDQVFGVLGHGASIAPRRRWFGELRKAPGELFQRRACVATGLQRRLPALAWLVMDAEAQFFRRQFGEMPPEFEQKRLEERETLVLRSN